MIKAAKNKTLLEVNKCIILIIAHFKNSYKTVFVIEIQTVEFNLQDSGIYFPQEVIICDKFKIALNKVSKEMRQNQE